MVLGVKKRLMVLSTDRLLVPALLPDGANTLLVNLSAGPIPDWDSNN